MTYAPEAMRGLEFLVDRISDARKTHITAAKLAAELSKAQNLSEEAASHATSYVLSLLKALGIVELTNDEVLLRDQIASYLLKSIHWFVQHDLALIDNWERAGVSGSVTNLFEAPARLLKAIEERRMQVAAERGLVPTPSRIQPAAGALIKKTLRGKAYFLHQWDGDARQFQLIGGKVRDNETPMMAVRREACEELAGDISHGEHFEIEALVPEPVVDRDISRTYGALTEYHATPFFLKFKIEKLMLGPHDKWISIDEMSAKETSVGERVAQWGMLYDAAISGGLAGLPNSFPAASDGGVGQWLEEIDWLEIEFRFFGVVIRPSPLYRRLVKRRRSGNR